MEWVKIEDKLPEEDQRVIYYFKETGIDIGIFTQQDVVGFKMNTFYGKSGFLSDDVTHWMPLPDVPLV